MSPQLNEALLGQKCKPLGSKPPASQARPEDYFYTVVAVWLEPRVFSQGDGTVTGYRLMCGLVSDNNGGANVLAFLDLEFSDLDFD